MMKSARVYCVIVTFNGARWVNNCFGSLRSSSIPVTTIVIDNGSSDGTQEAIRTNFPEVQIFQSRDNLGFGVANNQGIKMAIENDADYIFLLNQDAWIRPDTLVKLIDASRSDRKFGILSPIHTDVNGNLDKQFAMHIGPSYCNFFNDLYTAKLSDVYKASFVNAAAWLLTRECVNAVGLFEPLFFLYGEDINYVQRVAYHKFDVGIVPSSTVIHDRGERKGKKSELGARMEVRTFIYTKLLTIQGTFFSNLAQSVKVFVKFGFNLRSVKTYLGALLKLPDFRRRIRAFRNKSYLLN